MRHENLVHYNLLAGNSTTVPFVQLCQGAGTISKVWTNLYLITCAKMLAQCCFALRVALWEHCGTKLMSIFNCDYFLVKQLHRVQEHSKRTKRKKKENERMTSKSHLDKHTQLLI